jgi:predicted ATPase
MLNLLIAIISETFSAVTDKKTARKYQEKTKLISDYLFLDDDLEDRKKDELLIIATEDVDNKRYKQLSLKDVTKQIKSLDADVQGSFDKVNVKLKTQNEHLETLKAKQDIRVNTFFD